MIPFASTKAWFNDYLIYSAYQNYYIKTYTEIPYRLCKNVFWKVACCKSKELAFMKIKYAGGFVYPAYLPSSSWCLSFYFSHSNSAVSNNET